VVDSAPKTNEHQETSLRGKALPARKADHRRAWADYLGNVGCPTSRNPIGLNGLLQNNPIFIFLFFTLQLILFGWLSQRRYEDGASIMHGKRRIRTEFCWQFIKGRYNLVDLVADGRILNWILDMNMKMEPRFNWSGQDLMRCCEHGSNLRVSWNR
jgi:hypothetical protein